MQIFLNFSNKVGYPVVECQPGHMDPEYALGDKIDPVPVIAGRQDFSDKDAKPSRKEEHDK